MTKPISGTGELVILDSGFCVLKAIIELRKVGVFASAVIKKRKYLPKGIPGDKIKEHFEHCIVGDDDALAGRCDETDFYVFAMKDAGYVSMFMSTY